MASQAALALDLQRDSRVPQAQASSLNMKIRTTPIVGACHIGATIMHEHATFSNCGKSSLGVIIAAHLQSICGFAPHSHKEASNLYPIFSTTSCKEMWLAPSLPLLRMPDT
jgi:hypothetical protein